MNLGIKAVTTRYIARLDSDDEMLPERIQMQLKYLESNPECVLVGSQLIYITEEGQAIGDSQYPESDEQILRYMAFGNPVAHPSVMYRRDEILKAGLYNPKMEGAEDLDMWMRLAFFGKFKNLSAPLTRYRQHTAQISHKKQTVRTEIVIRVSILVKSRKLHRLTRKGYLLNALRVIELVIRLLFRKKTSRVIPAIVKRVISKYVS